MKLKYEITVQVPDDFSGVDPWGKIQTIEDFMNHLIFEQYELPESIIVLESGFNSFPENWWKELIPSNKWNEEKKELIKNNLITGERISWSDGVKKNTSSGNAIKCLQQIR